MARGKTVDRELVELILQMKGRNPMLTTEQIGAATCCDASTAGKIIKCGSWEGYCAFKDAKAKKEREKNRKAAEERPETQEAPLPGQIRMDLEPEKPEMSEQVKMMRFLAGQVDKLYMKLETINDTLSQILRAMRGD